MVLGMEVRLEIPAARAAALDERRRSMVGGTACGLCGIISLDRPSGRCRRHEPGSAIRAEAMRTALRQPPGRPGDPSADRRGPCGRPGFARGEILLLREDVGRHNALDKLVGAATRLGLDLGQSMLLLTSRCSTEMIQKAATAGFTMVVAISAPTSLAIALAEEAGMTLVAFARGDQFTAYTRPERICP